MATYKVTFYDIKGGVVATHTVSVDTQTLIYGESAIIRKAAREHNIRFFHQAKAVRQ